MQLRSRRLLIAQLQGLLQPIRIGAILFAGHPPDGANLHGQEQEGSLKDRSSLYGDMIRRGRTPAKPSARESGLPGPASRACKHVRPPYANTERMPPRLPIDAQIPKKSQNTP